MGAKVTRNGPGLKEALEGVEGNPGLVTQISVSSGLAGFLGRGKREVREFRVNIQEVSGE